MILSEKLIVRKHRPPGRYWVLRCGTCGSSRATSDFEAALKCINHHISWHAPDARGRMW